MAIDCDVLVIGAGPAGSSAARSAALNGSDVILIEKREKPGKTECGEAIGSYLIPYLPLALPKNQLIWKTKGMSFDTDNIHIERYGKLWEAYSINRGEFDYWLSKEAKRKGVKLFTNAELIDLHYNKNIVKKAIVKQDKKKIEICPKILIAADGTESIVSKILGLFNPKKDDIAEICSFEYKNVNNTNPDLEQIYLGEYINGGYGYIFPKSKKSINIGVGSIFKQNLEKSFEEFCELPQIKKQIKNATVVKEKSGKVPVISFIDKKYVGNVLLSGDAACQNFKPYAEGILPGIICGDICGKTASLFLKNRVKLESYEKKVKKKLGLLFEESDKITSILYNLFLMEDRKKFLILSALASNLFTYEEIKKMKEFEYPKIRDLIIKESENTFSKEINERLQLLFIGLKRIMNK